MNDNIIQYVLAVGNGDTDAMAKLYAGTLKGSYFLASKLSDSEAEAADITRRAYAKVFCTIDKLKKPEAFEIWLKQTIASIYKDSRKFVFADADGGALEPDSDFLPEAILENEADAEKVISAIASLSPERRTAIVLHYNNGMPVAVLSKFLGVSESTANAILSKARSEIIEKSGVKTPEYPELSTLPVLTRLFKKLAAEVSIDNSVVREMFIFILDCVEAAKPSESVEEEKEETVVAVEETVESEPEAEAETEADVEEEAEEAVEPETEETAEEEETAVEEETATEEAEEESATEDVAEESEPVQAEEEETAEEAVDKIEEDIVSFKDRISTIIGVEEEKESEEEPAEETAVESETVEETEEFGEIEEIDEAFDIEEAKEDNAAEEAKDEDLLEEIKRSMEDLNDFAENDETVTLDEDTGAISFANYKKEEEFKAEEPALPAAAEKKEAKKFESDKKSSSKTDKKVVIIVAAITIVIVGVIVAVIGFSAKNKNNDETTKPTSSYSVNIATQWKAVDALTAYDSITYLNEEYAMFEKDGKFGLLDNFGNVVLNADYDGFKMCSESKDYDGNNNYHLLAVKDDKSYDVTYENGIPTVTSTVHANHSIDTELTPGSEDYVERDRYYEGYAAVKNSDGKWGYVAKDSDMLVIDYLYDAPNAHSYAADSCRGFDKGVVAVKKDGKMGIINMDGTVVPFEYEEILQGEDGVYVAKKDGKWGLLLVGDEAIAFYADHQVATEAPGTTEAPAEDPVGTYVARDDINVRSGPSSDYDKLGTIDKGTKIVVYLIRDSENKDDSNDFAKIEYKGQVGWVSMGLLREE